MLLQWPIIAFDINTHELNIGASRAFPTTTTGALFYGTKTTPEGNPVVLRVVGVGGRRGKGLCCCCLVYFINCNPCVGSWSVAILDMEVMVKSWKPITIGSKTFDKRG